MALILKIHLLAVGLSCFMKNNDNWKVGTGLWKFSLTRRGKQVRSEDQRTAPSIFQPRQNQVEL